MWLKPTAPFLRSRRLAAALVHLAASGLLAASVAGAIFLLWFPGAYRDFSGGTELFLLIAGVDLALGPLITLVIFDTRKPRRELQRDVGVVILLQLAALVYGLNMLSISRPVALALEEDRLRVVAASGVRLEELPSAPQELRALSWTGPQLVRSALPSDPVQKSKAVELGLAGYDIGTRPSLWRPWDDDARAEAIAHAKPVARLAERFPHRQAELDGWVTKTGASPKKLVYLPMITFRGDWVALLDETTGKPVGFAPFDGF